MQTQTESTKPKILRGEGVKSKRTTAKTQKILRIFSPVILLLIWEIASRSGFLDIRFFPAPSMIAGSAVSMLADGELLKATGITLSRLFSGYIIGALLGIIIGIWLGLSSWSRSLFEPWIQITYPIPKLAIYPLIILIVGMGELPIVILIAIATFYIVVISAIAGVLFINKTMLDVGKDNNATFLQFFTTIALPASLPHIITSLEVSLGMAYIVIIAVEFLGASSGLGYIIWTSWSLFDVPPMFVSIVTISVLGYFSVIVVRWLGTYLMPWRKAEKR